VIASAKCVRKRNFPKVTLKSAPAYFVATFPVSRTAVPAIETLEKMARALEAPLYQLFYDGEEPPKLPNLLKRKSSDEGAWGSSGRDARFLGKLRRLLGKANEQDRKVILFMAQKMALR
jgi:hypothetical protein